jgi:hypothetical protein
MKAVFWILVLGALGSAAMAVGLGQAAGPQVTARPGIGAR